MTNTARNIRQEQSLSNMADKAFADARDYNEARDCLLAMVADNKAILNDVIEEAVASAIRQAASRARQRTIKCVADNSDAPPNLLKLSKGWLRSYTINGKKLNYATLFDIKKEMHRSKMVVGTLETKMEFLRLLAKEVKDEHAPIGGQVSEDRIKVLAGVAGYVSAA